MIPTVAYYRMSTDKQETSIPAQRAEVAAYAASHGYTIVREYLDEGISGDATEKRKGFQQMLADAKGKRDFRAVLCWDQDRFGRFDPLEAGYWVKPLRDVGVYLETVAQGRIDWEDFAGRIIYAVQQEAKHAFLRDLSRNVVRGQLAASKAGKWLGGYAGYGYELVEGRLVPGDTAKVEVVRWLFTTYATGGMSLRGLALDLNGRGVVGPGGKQWSVASIHKILRQRVYVGDWVWNKRRAGRYFGIVGGAVAAASRRKLNDAADWLIRENNHPPLVERALFEQVQARLLSQRDCKTPLRNGGDFLFTRLLFCSDCGWPMHGARLHCNKAGRTYSYRRYICGNYNLHGASACKCNTLLEDTLRDAVVARLQEWFADPVTRRELRAEILAELKSRQKPTAAADLRRQIAALEKDIALRERKLHLIDEDSLPAYQQELREARETLRRLQGERDAVRVEPNFGREVEQAVAELKNAGEGDRLLLREVIRQAVERIDCEFRHVPYGKRQKSVLTGGTITIRPDAVFPNMFTTPGRVRTSLKIRFKVA